MQRGFGSMGIVLAAVLGGGAGCSQPTQSRLLDSYGWQAPGRGIEVEGAAMLRVADASDETCRFAQLPWQGPALCGPGAVLRPARGTCSVFADLSPRVDPLAGFYRGDRDAKNWLATGRSDVLELLAAYVIENGEGDHRPHGPHGNLYWDLFGPFEPLRTSQDGALARRISGSHVLRGPHRTHGTTDEWLDDEVLTYGRAGLFRWGSTPGTEDMVVLRVWESDGDEDGFLGRRNDVLGMEHVRRSDTEQPCGLWVPFHRYTNAHPRTRTTTPALWLLLRTRPPPGPFDVLANGHRGRF
jgi:hypothetical protein